MQVSIGSFLVSLSNSHLSHMLFSLLKCLCAHGSDCSCLSFRCLASCNYQVILLYCVQLSVYRVKKQQGRGDRGIIMLIAMAAAYVIVNQYNRKQKFLRNESKISIVYFIFLYCCIDRTLMISRNLNCNINWRVCRQQVLLH